MQVPTTRSLTEFVFVYAILIEKLVFNTHIVLNVGNTTLDKKIFLYS